MSTLNAVSIDLRMIEKTIRRFDVIRTGKKLRNTRPWITRHRRSNQLRTLHATDITESAFAKMDRRPRIDLLRMISPIDPLHFHPLDFDHFIPK